METIDSLNGVSTSLTTDTQIETIEIKLLNLSIDGDGEAAQQYADLYLSRLDWERTRSAELWRSFLDHAHDADAWLAVNSP